ncbi:MAG: oxidoreductase [Pseudonocardia sp.]|nr:oxidoreductase [Pseudonocardia sp.]
MGLLSRMRGGRKAVRTRSGDEEHLRAWTATHAGVEAFVEPRTAVTETTMILVATDGEWTRRRVSGPDGARRIARSLKIPVYDVQIVGYPQRMRDHDARQRILRGQERRRDLGA